MREPIPPLQALLLLNDKTYIESARALATMTLTTEQPEPASLQQLWRRVLSRSPRDDELRQLDGLLQRQRTRYAANPTAADDLLATGVSPLDNSFDPQELAAWTVVAHAILNLDEAIMRR